MMNRMGQNLRQLAILAFAMALAGCSQDVDNYAHVTSQALTELDGKIRTYSADSARLNDARQSNQMAVIQQDDALETTNRQIVDVWTVANDKERLRLLDSLRQASEHAAAEQDRTVSALDLKSIQSPATISGAAKSLDSLARDQSVTDQFKILVKYATEVKDDIAKDQAAKGAEAAAAPKPPAKP